MAMIAYIAVTKVQLLCEAANHVTSLMLIMPGQGPV